MKQRRESTTDKQLDLEANPISRARKISGIGSRGVGIKVHGDEPFDPYRFQDFEVTPAFRQKILEAPLPLLELRDLIVDQVPPSQQRPRAGANDITQPAVPKSDQGADDPVIEFSDLSSDEMELLLTPTPTVDREAITARMRISVAPNATGNTDPLPIAGNVPATAAVSRSPRRTVLFMGALGLLFLGLAYAYLNKPATAASPQPSPKVAESVLPSEPQSAEYRAAMHEAEPQKLGAASRAVAEPRQQSAATSQQAKASAGTLKDPARLASNPAKPSGKQGPAKKTLWLPAE